MFEVCFLGLASKHTAVYEKRLHREYWIVEPDGKLVNVFVLQDNQKYGRPEIYTEEYKVEVSIFQDLVVDLKPVFEGV